MQSSYFSVGRWGLFFLFGMLLVGLIYPSHYLSSQYKTLGLQDSTTTTDTSTSGTSTSGTTTDTSTSTPTDTSTPPYTDSGTGTPPATGTTTTTNPDGSTTTVTTYGSDSSSTSTTTTNPDGTTVTTYTYTYFDQTTGQQITSVDQSTSRTYTTESGATVTESSSTYQYYDHITGQYGSWSTSYSSSSFTDSATGNTVSTYSTLGTYPDPVTGGTKTYTTDSETTTDASGRSTTRHSGDWGVSESTYDPATGTSTFTDTWTDPATGQSYTSSSTSTTRTEVDPETGATTYIYESRGTSTDRMTGEVYEYVNYGSSASVTNPDGTTTYITENTYTDYQTGQLVTGHYESTYNSETGESTSVGYQINPETGERVEISRSESQYDLNTGEGSTRYTYTDPTTGLVYNSESTTTVDTVGNTIYTYIYTDPVTGDTRETDYGGTFGGGWTGTAYTYSDESGSYTYYYDEGAPPSDVRTYITSDGSTYVYTDTSGEQSALTEAYGETFAAVVDADLPVGIVQHDLIEDAREEGTILEDGTIVRDVVGEPIVPYTEYVEQIGERAERELTDTELNLITQEYENLEERIIYTGEKPIDVAPETYNQYVNMYEVYQIPEDQRMIDSSEDFQFTVDLREEFYTRRDEIYAAPEDEFSLYERALAQRELEAEMHERYKEQFGEIQIYGDVVVPGDLDAVAVPETLPALTPEAINVLVRGEFESEFKRLTDAGIPTDHPQWRSLAAQAEARRDELLDRQSLELVDVVISSCQGSVGGAGESCGQVAEVVNTIALGCTTGDSGAACSEAAQVIATQLDGCGSASDKAGCMGEVTRIASEVEEYTRNPEVRDVWTYGVEITPERFLGQDVYQDYRTCGGGAGCAEQEEQRYAEHVQDSHDAWRVQYESLTPEQREEYRQEFDARRDEYRAYVEPVMEDVRAELPAEEKPVFDKATERIEQFDDRRLGLIERFIDTAEAEGHDTALLNFYSQKFQESLDGSREEGTHSDLEGMVGNLRQCAGFFHLFVEEAKRIEQTDSAGSDYEAPDTPVVQ